MAEQKCIFYDDATKAALFTALLPGTFACRTKYRTIQNQNGIPELQFQGAAFDSARHIELYFENGKEYTSNPPQPGAPYSGVYHQYCDARQQLDELISSFIGQNPAALRYDSLPEERMQDVMRSGSESVGRWMEAYRQVARMQPVPILVSCTGTILDGIMGVYPFEKDGSPKTLYSALWRTGMGISMNVQGYSILPMPGREYCSWTIPMVINMIQDGQPDQETYRIFAAFVNTIDKTPEFRQYSLQVEAAGTNQSLQYAAGEAQQTAAVYNHAFAQQQAAWARSDALRDSLSRDLDNFRAGQAANAAGMDAFRAGLHSSDSSGISGFGSAESLDDRIQRGRHEAMMGVNTYVRDDGTEYEHTTMDTRVFESNLDQNEHFGTENYFGDFVPDGWHEMKKK